jgi:hypothetical protein
VQLEERPRLADWGLYAAALYESQGWGVDAFVEDWRGVEETQQQGTLDGSVVAQAVILYMKDKDRVELSAAKLHAALVARAEDDRDLKDDRTWPKTGRTLWKKIREVTPLLEVHGIRAYRKNDNRAGRPIVLDTDFNDDGPDGESTDDNADDNYPADDNFSVSSTDTVHTNGETDDNANYGRYFGHTLGSHTLIKKKEEGQGERNTDLPSASSAVSPAEEFLEPPPEWFRKQAALCVEHGRPERLVKPLVCSVSYTLFGTADRHQEVRPAVEAWLEEVR